MDSARDFLAAARTAICDRPAKYGPPDISAAAIAGLWNAYLANREPLDMRPLELWDIFAMLALMKVARGQQDPQHADSWVDGAGYLALAGEVARCRVNMGSTTEPEAA